MEIQNALKNGCIAGLAATLVLGAALTAQAFDPAREVVTPDGERSFVNINPAIKMAPAFGDRSKGGHGSFGQFPANFTTPFHTHTGAYHGIVIKGEMTNPFKGESKPATMGPGSYWYVPANSVHATACVSQTPCEFYFHADTAFDFHPAK